MQVCDWQKYQNDFISTRGWLQTRHCGDLPESVKILTCSNGSRSKERVESERKQQRSQDNDALFVMIVMFAYRGARRGLSGLD